VPEKNKYQVWNQKTNVVQESYVIFSIKTNKNFGDLWYLINREISLNHVTRIHRKNCQYDFCLHTRESGQVVT